VNTQKYLRKYIYNFLN